MPLSEDCYSKYINTFRRLFLGPKFYRPPGSCPYCGIPLEPGNPAIHDRPYGLWFCSESCTRRHAADNSDIPPFILRWDPWNPNGWWPTYWPAIKLPLPSENAPAAWITGRRGL